MKILKGKFALVTGASSGLGKDFSDILGKIGCNLILTARRYNILQAQKETLEKKYNIRVEIIPLDLAQPNSPEVLYTKTKQLNIAVDILINNAGVGVYGDFSDIPFEEEKNMLNLDVINVVHMTNLFLNDMKKKNFGYILNIASIGAYQPSPKYAIYCAAKSFILSFTEALNYELKNTNIKVTALSPGVTKTEFFQTAGQKKLTWFQKYSIMKSYPVAELGINAMLKGKPSVIAGFLNNLTVFFYRFLPRKSTTAIASWAMRGGK